jgi:SAM-dependent methyltransferase
MKDNKHLAVAGPGILGWPRKILRDIRSEGFFEVARWGARLVYTHFREWRLGVRTQGHVYWDDTEIDPANINYEPLDYTNLDHIFDRLRIREGEDTFLDYGSGKGRALAIAATYPFRRVLGVEMSEELVAISEQNLASVRRKRCEIVNVVHGDATAFRVPVDVNVIYFFNPFVGHILESVMQQIYASLREAPRILRIEYVIWDFYPNRLADYEWLTEVSMQVLPVRKNLLWFEYVNNEFDTETAG